MKAKSDEWTQQDETAFLARLEQELRKCEVFQRNKVNLQRALIQNQKFDKETGRPSNVILLSQADELSERITELEHSVVKLVQSWDAQFTEDEHSGSPQSGNVERQGDPEYEPDAGSDDEGDDEGDDMSMTEESYDEQFAQLEEESRMLVSDVHELAQFTKLNFTGFIKIVKVGLMALVLLPCL